MITFKQFYLVEKQIIDEGLLLEGKYLDMVKHFMKNVYNMREIYYDTEEFNKKMLDTGRGKIWDKGNDINFLASESRSLISNIPEFYQKKMKRFIETVSGEPIGEFDDEVVERMFGNNSYKGYFRLYVINFLLETLIMESMEKETAFDKMLKDISDVFDLVDSIGDDVAMPNKIKSVLSLVPKIISIVGRFVKMAADSFEK